MKRAFLILIASFLFLSAKLNSQAGSPERDKYLLLTMPYNMHQLTLFRGEYQADAGYKFAVRTQTFTSDGDKILLRNNGTGSVYHYYFAEIRYGLTNFIEIGAETNFLRRGIRDATQIVNNTTVSSSEMVTVNKLTESKGMGDLFLFTTIRLPIEYHWFDFAVRGGFFLPSAKHETLKPSNSVSELTAADAYTVNLHYNYSNGYGVPVCLIGVASKLSFRKISAEAWWTIRDPVKEGNNIRWEETFTDRVFSYFDKSYSYLLSRTYTFDASLHYQATGWFNMYLNGSFFKTKDGWTGYWGKKYRNPEKRLINIEPGFELQISPSLVVSQVAGFPLRGKNNDAPFYLFTTLSWKLFPFLK